MCVAAFYCIMFSAATQLLTVCAVRCACVVVWRITVFPLDSNECMRPIVCTNQPSWLTFTSTYFLLVISSTFISLRSGFIYYRSTNLQLSHMHHTHTPRNYVVVCVVCVHRVFSHIQLISPYHNRNSIGASIEKWYHVYPAEGHDEIQFSFVEK